MARKILLDREVFAALASDTRVAILKELDQRRKTLAELSRSLSAHKSALHKHLVKLVEAGLVSKHYDRHKWKYYSLTWKGKHLLHPEQMKIRLLLSLAVGTCVGAAGAAYLFFAERWANDGASITGQEGEAAAWPGYLALVLLLVGVTLAIMGLRIRHQAQEERL